MTRDDDRLEDKLDSVKENLYSLDSKVQVLSEKFMLHMEQDTRNLANISHSLESITDRLFDYNETLVEHVSRSTALETSNELMREQIDMYKTALEARLNKLEAPQKWVQTTLWILAALATILTIVDKLKG